MNLTETPLSQDRIYDGRILRLRVDEALLPDGTTAKREVVEHAGGVCVAALTERDELLFVRQFRYPYAEVVTELPAGKLDAGETPEQGGRRELREETGMTAERLIPMGRLYPSPGYTDEIIHLFAATGLHAGEMSPDEDEFLEVERIPLTEAVGRVMRGELDDAKTQILILKLWVQRQQEQKK